MVVASLPNVRYYPVLKELMLTKNFEDQDSGVLDRTHLRFFTEASMGRLFADTGYRTVSVEGIKTSPLPWKLGLLNKFLYGALDDTRYMQFAVSARLN